ncbi:MAG: hypothetical protein AAGI88_10995 [Pseudomonadota bacterium]
MQEQDRDAAESEQRRQAVAAIAPLASTKRPGFSARLNMLFSLAGEREIARQRPSVLAALVPDWTTRQIRGWLTEDIVPSSIDLDLLVRYLASRLANDADHRHWEAFLLFGTDLVPNPLYQSQRQNERKLTQMATDLILELARENKLAPDSYDAQLALARMTAALRDLNVDPDQGFIQDGHKRMLFARVFGSQNRH